MSKLRVIYQNLADAATITATEISGYPVANVKTDTKSTWHRSNTTSIMYTLTWTEDKTIGGVVLPCTNLSKTATIFVKFYSGTGNPVQYTWLNTSAVAISACQDSPIQAWTNPNGNSFTLGAVSKSSWWLTTQLTTVRKIEIILQDPSNPATYIDCARIICGPYWQPRYSVDRTSLSVSSTDTTENIRTDAGSIITNPGFIHDELQFSLGLLEDSDRDELVKILQYSGTSKYLLFSVFPGENNSRSEQLYTVYGKRTNNAIQYVISGFSSHPVQVLGW